MKLTRWISTLAILSMMSALAYAAAEFAGDQKPNGQPLAVVSGAPATFMSASTAAAPAAAAPQAATALDPRGLAPINPKSPYVVPIDWSRFTSAIPNEADDILAKTVLQNANQYAVTTWYSEKKFDRQTNTYIDFGGIDEDHIRGPAAEAFSLAVSLKLGAYSETGSASKAAATEIAVKLVRSLAYHHLVNSSGGWGDDWQTALWAYYAGTAGWLLWDELCQSATATDCTAYRKNVRQMVEYEANRQIGTKVLYYRNRAGVFNGRDMYNKPVGGDTKAEENSWNAMVLQLATAMMPAHPAYRAWLYKDVELMLSSYARPNDVNAAALYNGFPLSTWLNGSNAEQNFMAVNHDRIHPDYTVSVSQNLNALVMSAMAGVPAPEAALFNSADVYSALTDYRFVPTSAIYPGTIFDIASPGGPIFTRTSSNNPSADLYYPQGNDWGTKRRMNSAAFDAMAAAFGLDAGSTIKAPLWEKAHMQYVKDSQDLHSDKRTYGDDDEDTYGGREEWVASLAARAWWAKWVAYKQAFGTSNEIIAQIIDNKDLGFSIVSGGSSWVADKSSPEKLGSGNYISQAGLVSNKVRFSFTVPQAGSYNIYAWWSGGSTNAPDARYRVNYGGTFRDVLIDQRSNGGRFNLLGTFTFSAGSPLNVELTGSANGRVVADGVLIKPTASP